MVSPRTGPLRVVVADDHAPTRAQIRESLQADGFVVCGEASTGRGAVETVAATRPDIALLDITMPDGTGIEAAAAISRSAPDTTIIMLTYSREDRDLFDSLRAGAQGYLVKDMDPDRLGATLRTAIAGEAALSRSLMAAVVEEFRSRAAGAARGRQRAPQLTDREWQVAELLRAGASTEEIAAQLSLSPTTVRVHVMNIVKKLRVEDRHAAVRLLNEG